MEYLGQGYIAVTLLLTLIQTSVCQQQDITVKYDNGSLTKLSTTTNNTGESLLLTHLPIRQWSEYHFDLLNIAIDSSFWGW